jgi:hypothetical protein
MSFILKQFLFKNCIVFADIKKIQNLKFIKTFSISQISLRLDKVTDEYIDFDISHVYFTSIYEHRKSK